MTFEQNSSARIVGGDKARRSRVEICIVLCSFCDERGDECEAATPWRGPTSLSVLGRTNCKRPKLREAV
jgi:hypothetical protein